MSRSCAAVRPWVIAAVAAAAATSTAACRSHAPSRRDRCTRLLRGFAGAFTAGLAAALDDADGAKTACLRDHGDDLEACLDPADATAYRAAMIAAVAQCEAWPEAALRCLERFDDSPACEPAYAALQGLDYSPVRGAGPAPRWQLQVDGVEQLSDAVAAAGTLYASAEKTVVAIGDGAERWRRSLDDAPTLLAVVGGCLLTDADGLRCLDTATGATRWTLPRGDGGGWLAAMSRGAGAVVVGDDGQWGELDPARCADDPAGCLRRHPPLPGGPDVASMTRSLVDLGDRWAYVGDDQLYLIGGDGAVSARLAVRGGGGFVTDGAATADGALIVGWADGIFRVTPAACAGADGADERDAPPGCVTRIGDRDPEAADGYAPVPVADGAIVGAGGELRRWRAGARVWAVDVGAATPMIPGGDVVYVAGAGDLDGPAEVRAVAIADGATAWRTQLTTLPRPGLLDVPQLVADDATLYVVLENAVAALPRRP
ncbi:MAG: hypothetical protein H6709_03025 [Kofleriaceae bacterium]|nr:hypothetical protein [Kofleriaceae bacterium]MCB9571041.1 hypothetical protein [Kofleriaceae bacterium]